VGSCWRTPSLRRGINNQQESGWQNSGTVSRQAGGFCPVATTLATDAYPQEVEKDRWFDPTKDQPSVFFTHSLVVAVERDDRVDDRSQAGSGHRPYRTATSSAPSTISRPRDCAANQLPRRSASVWRSVSLRSRKQGVQQSLTFARRRDIASPMCRTGSLPR
jgi:hypothetical protein